MSSFSKYSQTILSIIAIILSLIAICSSFPRRSFLELDYIGIIVGILGSLVAILLGWQLYNALHLNELVEQTQKAKKDAIKAMNKAKSLLRTTNKLTDDIKEKVNSITVNNQNNTTDIKKIAGRIKQLHELISQISSESQILSQNLDTINEKMDDKLSKTEVKKASPMELRDMVLESLGIDIERWNKIVRLSNETRQRNQV